MVGRRGDTAGSSLRGLSSVQHRIYNLLAQQQQRQRRRRWGGGALWWRAGALASIHHCCQRPQRRWTLTRCATSIASRRAATPTAATPTVASLPPTRIQLPVSAETTPGGRATPRFPFPIVVRSTLLTTSGIRTTRAVTPMMLRGRKTPAAGAGCTATHGNADIGLSVPRTAVSDAGMTSHWTVDTDRNIYRHSMERSGNIWNCCPLGAGKRPGATRKWLLWKAVKPEVAVAYRPEPEIDLWKRSNG